MTTRYEAPKMRNPVKAIREFCVECMGGNRQEVAKCTAPKCALFEFRLGKNPYRETREMTEEQRAAAVERLAKARAAQSA